jgi:hypothetical protein
MKYRIIKLERVPSHNITTATRIGDVYEEYRAAATQAKRWNNDAIKNKLPITYIVEAYSIDMVVLKKGKPYIDRFNLDKKYLLARSADCIDFDFNDWDFERSSGFAGYRNRITMDWLCQTEYKKKNAETCEVVVLASEFNEGEEFFMSDIEYMAIMHNSDIGNFTVYSKVQKA